MKFDLQVTPDLLTRNNGEAVTAGSWQDRRIELYNAIVPQEYGGIPPIDEPARAHLRSDASMYPHRSIKYKTYGIVCKTNGKEIGFTLKLWIPPGEGPYPVVLDGDGCWRYFNDEIVKQVVDRGYIAASFDRTELAADSKTGHRETGLYKLIPDGGFGALAAWAWGYHRCVDVLTTLDNVDGDRLAITGHSRGGKAVILAGATDERITVTNPNCSGCGGSGLNRLKADGAEVIDDFNKSGNMFWFGSGYTEYAGNDAEIPYDQHFLHALIAPRCLLVSEAYGDPWANPPGSYAACRAAEDVYTILGAEGRLGWSIREGEHAHASEDYQALLDFLDLQFCGIEVPRSFKRPIFPNIGKILKRP